MRERKGLVLKRLAALLLFVVIGLLIFARVSEILRAKTGQAIDMIHSFYSLEEDEVDVLFLGSSHGYSAADPNLLWNEFGITSYTMCSYDQSVPSSYYLLKEALKYQTPKVVLLETYTFCDDELYRSEARLRQTFDGIRLDDVKLEMIEDFLGDASFSEKMTYYLPFLKYHSRWSELEDSDFNTKNYLKGFRLNTEIEPVEDPGMPDDTSVLGTAACEYFEKIQHLCKENNIQLVVFATPFGIKSSYKHYRYRQGINNTLETWLSEKGIPFLYFQKTGEANIDFSTDFRDKHHLNAYGATKITRCIGEFLVNKFEITDHRGDSFYDERCNAI